jgi:hypothetical protein
VLTGLTEFVVAEGLLVSVLNVIYHNGMNSTDQGGYTLVTLPRIVTPYRDSVGGTRDRVTYQKLVTR